MEKEIPFPFPKGKIFNVPLSVGNKKLDKKLNKDIEDLNNTINYLD